MTARITGSIRPQAQFADSAVRANHIARNKALGIRDTEGDVSARAEARLWRSPRSATSPRPRYAKDETPVRAVAAVGFSNGPVGRTDRVIGDGLAPRLMA